MAYRNSPRHCCAIRESDSFCLWVEPAWHCRLHFSSVGDRVPWLLHGRIFLSLLCRFGCTDVFFSCVMLSCWFCTPAALQEGDVAMAKQSPEYAAGGLGKRDRK